MKLAIGNISTWKTHNRQDMPFMFKNATSFNQDLSSWIVGNVATMKPTFHEAKAFNRDLNTWNVAKVANMDMMFKHTSFNGNICNWKLSSLRSCKEMFCHAVGFDQDISAWLLDFSAVNLESMFHKSGLTHQLQKTPKITSMTLFLPNKEDVIKMCNEAGTSSS